jgi:hypothetical protein
MAFNLVNYIFTIPNLIDLIMNTIKIRENNLSSKILCSFFGHKIITTRNVTNHFKEYKCSVCGLELTDDLKGHKTFLTPELKDINETLLSLYQKRHLKYLIITD